jgi:cytochrome c-type biogenesis protein CcmE
VQERAPHGGGSPDGALVVEYASLETPDLFKDGAEVVVEGKLTAAGTFHATNLLAKCPSKFEAKAREAEAAKAI